MISLSFINQQIGRELDINTTANVAALVEKLEAKLLALLRDGLAFK